MAILDIRMPPEPDGGLPTAERLRAAHPELGLLFLSHYAEAHYLMRVLHIGTDAIGYRLKEKVGSVEVLSAKVTVSFKSASLLSALAAVIAAMRPAAPPPTNFALVW